MSEIGVERRELVITQDGRVHRSPVADGIAPALFRHVIAAVDMLYRRSGVFPSVKAVAETWEPFTEAEVSKVLSTPEAREALSIRGVEMDLKKGLTDEQLMALLILQNPADGRSTESKLKQVGISMNKYRAWMRNPLFSRAMTEQAEHNLSDAMQMALNKIVAQAEAGDMRAAEKILEMTGRWNPQQQEIQNAKAVVLTVMEAVQRHVDRDTLKKILDEVASKSKVLTITQGLNEL